MSSPERITRASRRGSQRFAPQPRRRLLLAALVAFIVLSSSTVWLRHVRVQAIADLQSRAALQIQSTEGWLWPTHLNGVGWRPSPNLSASAASIELGVFPWQRAARAHGVVVRATAPLELAWEQARSLTLPADLQVTEARFEYSEPSARKLEAEEVTFQAGSPRDHLHARSLQVFGATIRDVHAWVSRPTTALQLRFTRDADDARAPTLSVTRSVGQGVEWAWEIPSQPLSEWAHRAGLRLDDGWQGAVFVGVGSLIVPDSPAHPARANFRFTLDNWHRPSWPDAALLMGRSGAVALRLTPGPDATHAITRVEVAAGLFSLLGTGQLSFGTPNRLTFHAQGELDCARLLAHLPPSSYRDRVQAYVTQVGSSANTTHAGLELDAVAEAPSQLPLQFRWRLREGCGLPEMKED